MAGDLLRIREFLSRLRRRSLLLSGLELLLFAGTLLCTLVLMAAALGGVGWTHAALAVLFWAVLAGGPLAWLWRVTWPRHRPLHRPEGAARFVDSRVPDMHNLTLSALELDPDRASREGFSPELVQATVRRAADRVGALTPAALIPASPVRPWALSFAAAGSALAAVVLLVPGQLEANLAAFFAPPVEAVLPSAITQNKAGEGPALGDITLTLVYPAYLNRPTDVLENSNGEILAPVGTQVTISARASLKPSVARLEVIGAPPIAAAIAPDGRFSAGFSVETKGTYRFVLIPPEGGEPIVSRSYPIEVEADSSPTIEVLGLESITEVSPNAPLNFGYTAQDDHGLTRIEVVVEGPKGVSRKLVRELPAETDRDEGEVTFYPSEWEIPQGGAVEMWLEVRDDDTVSGPKVGKSSRYKIVLSSPERRREQVLNGKEQLKEAMIAVLGDSLVQHAEPLRDKTAATYTREHQQLAEGMTKVTAAFAALREMMEGDELEEKVVYRATLALEEEIVDLWEALEQGLKERANGAPDYRAVVTGQELKERRGRFIGAFERGILSMESFANLQRMESILASGQEMKKVGEDLRSMLEQLKKSGKQPDMKALMSKLDQMEQKLQQMAQQMSQLDQSSAEWFQNPSGEVHEIKDAMQEIRDLLAQGKTEEAMKKLEEYLKATDDLMNNLQQMQRDEFGDNRDQMVKDMEGAINGLKEMEQQQKKLHSDTQAIKEGLQKKAGLTPEKLEQMSQEALKKLEQMRESVAKTEESMRQAGGIEDREAERHLRELKDRMQTLEAALKSKDLGRSLRESSDSIRGFRVMDMDITRMEEMGGADMQEARASNQSGKKAAEQLAKELENMARKVDQMQDQAAGQGQGLASRQQSLQQKGQALGERMKEYSKDSPMIPGSWSERLEKASKAMQAASGKLGNGELAGGAADQQMALQELGEIRKEMEAAQKEMAQRQRGQNGQGRQQFQTGRQGQGKPGQAENWGRDVRQTGKVDISKDYKAPEEYRREIMEGMKGDAPSRYKRLNREYYEKLVR